MPAKPAVPTKRSDAPEQVYQGLRRFNLVMGFLHLVQGILMIVLSNDTTYPIYTNYLEVAGEDVVGLQPGAKPPLPTE